MISVLILTARLNIFWISVGEKDSGATKVSPSRLPVYHSANKYMKGLIYDDNQS